MHECKTLGRREFTVASALAALSGVAITISGCGGGSSGGSPTTPSTPTPTPTPAAGGDVMGTISANHGHTAVISAARLADPAMVELDIRGIADHRHTVGLSAEEVQQIAGGQQVAKVSSEDAGHSHTVTFN
jgi:hypothetical protein